LAEDFRSLLAPTR